MTVAVGNVDLKDGRSLRSGFIRHAQQTPERPALVVGAATLTYGAMDHTARIWAGAIVRRLSHRAERVGVFAYRSQVAYQGTLAALYAGAAYVPLNRTFPVDRTISMAQDGRLDAIIVDAGSLPHLKELLAALNPCPVILLPDADTWDGPESAQIVTRRDLEATPPLAVLPPVLQDDLAYLLFTSGSTGKPKGVGVTHANILYFLEIMQRRFGIVPEDRFSQTFAQTFDVSVWDLFMAWEYGASVHAMRQIDLLAPTKYINQHQLTVWFSVPSVVAFMRRKNYLRPNSMPTLRYSLFAGEPLPRRSAELWLEAAPNSVVENLYGPTELTIVCIGYRWDPATSQAQCLHELVPMGQLFEGLVGIVVGPDGTILGNDQEGELYIAGPQTVPGYWQNEEKTADRFALIPLSQTMSKRFYKTGDRVLRRTDGTYLYLGRVDHQIKVRGYRVELSEIEGLLCQDPAVDSAVAMGWPFVDGRAEGIVAFVAGKDVDTQRLKGAAQKSLPPYMVPRDIHVLDDMPLNANGKVDRSALAERLTAA
ncbi:MAG: amino acid adenylation domain-containing protein [Nitrospira sp.]